MNDILHIIHTDLRRNEKETLATDNRRQNMLNQCSQQGIKFKIVPGVVSERPTFHNINQAHKNVIMAAKALQLPYCHIAEDDFIFTGPGGWQYYLNNIPESFDLYMSVIYAGTLEERRVVSPFSGGMTLYTVHERFYDFVLSIPRSVHIDRYLGEAGRLYEFLTPPLFTCKQMGGYSFNHRGFYNYQAYEEGKSFFTGQ